MRPDAVTATGHGTRGRGGWGSASTRGPKISVSFVPSRIFSPGGRMASQAIFLTTVAVSAAEFRICI
jgi:hypothetical protein